MDARFLQIANGMFEKLPRVRWVEFAIGKYKRIPKIGKHSLEPEIIEIGLYHEILFGGGDYTNELGVALATVMLTHVPMADMSIDKNLICGFRFIDRSNEFRTETCIRFGWAYEQPPVA